MYSTCLRCGYAWSPRSGTPVRCPQCKSTRWNIEHVTRKCLRCGAEWNQRGNTVPRYCPSCHSSVWNEPKVEFVCPRCGKIRTLRSNSRRDQCPYCDEYKDSGRRSSPSCPAPKAVTKPVRVWTDGKGLIMMYSKGSGTATVYEGGILVATTNLDSWLRTRNYSPESVMSSYREEYMQREFEILAKQMYAGRNTHETKAESIKTLHPVSDKASEIIALSESGMQPVAIALKLRLPFTEVMDTLANVPPMQPPAKLDKKERLKEDDESQTSEEHGEHA